MAWLGNVFLFCALFTLFLPFRLPSTIAALTAVMLKASFIGKKEVLVNEAGQQAKILKLSSGFWLWLSSGFVILLGNIISLLIFKREKQSTKHSSR